MSTSVAQYSKIYPDYFFKYRFTEEAQGIYGIVAESDMFPQQKKRYEYSVDFAKRIHNLSVILEKIPYSDLVNVLNGEIFEINVDLVVVPVDLSTFCRREITLHFVPSSIFHSTETIIMSGPPKLSLTTSISFLTMDFEVAFCFCLLAIIISIMMLHKTWYNVITKPKLSAKKLRKIITEYLKILWNIISIFFYEPFPNRLYHISERILLGFWLIGVLFIGFIMSCFLKSEFFDENFLFVDTIDALRDFQKRGEVEPLMLKDALVYHYLKNKAQEDKFIRDWLENELNDDNFCETIDLIDLDTYIPILEGKKALIQSRQFVNWFFGYSLIENMDRMGELKKRSDGFYFSPYIKSDILLMAVNSSFVQNILFKENFNLGILVMFETKAFDYMDFESEMAMDYVKWKKPMKTATNLSIFAMAGVFYVTLTGFVICIVVFLLELRLGFSAYAPISNIK